MKYKKGTFLVIPNRNELQGKPCEFQTLYFWLCSFANDEGQCFPSRTTLAKSCNFSSLRTVDKYIEMLVEAGFIGKKKRVRKGGKSNLSNLYQVRVLNAPRSADDDTTPGATNSTITISNITQSTKLTPVAKAPEILFSLKEEIKKLEESHFRPNNILALFFVARKINIENKEQLKITINRHIKSAIKLQSFSDNQILKAIDYCKDKHKDIEWTIDTLIKILTK